MKAIQLAAPASLDNLKLVDLPDPAAPGPGEIAVRLRASSLNYHDYAVVKGMLRPRTSASLCRTVRAK